MMIMPSHRLLPNPLPPTAAAAPLALSLLQALGPVYLQALCRRQLVELALSAVLDAHPDKDVLTMALLEGEGEAGGESQREERAEAHGRSGAWEDLLEAAVRRAAPLCPSTFSEKLVPEDFCTGLISLSRFNATFGTHAQEHRRKILFGSDQVSVTS